LIQKNFEKECTFDGADWLRRPRVFRVSLDILIEHATLKQETTFKKKTPLPTTEA
jgi:hypothetical protein